MALRARPAGRSAGVVFCMFGVVAITASLTGCAEPARSLNSSPAAASRSQPYRSYPPVGTAVSERNPICRLARNPAVPAAKRSSAAGECDTLLSHAIVTKPVPPPGNYIRPSPSSTRPAAADCRSSQLGARFVGGGFGTGNDFGEIVIWNAGTRPCRLHGPVSFAAYYADASRDRKATVNRPITATPSTLPGRMPAPRDGQDPAGYLVAGLMGPERDDPAQPNALCRPRDEGTPASLELSIGSITVQVTNKDSGSPQNTSIYGCHGTVLLVDVRGPSS
jgi:hypothetical protein